MFGLGKWYAGLGSFARGSRLAFVQISSIYRMINKPLILVTGRSRSLEGLRRNSVASTNLVKIPPKAKMAGELGIVVAFYYY